MLQKFGILQRMRKNFRLHLKMARESTDSVLEKIGSSVSDRDDNKQKFGIYESKGQLSMRGSFKALHIHGKGGQFSSFLAPRAKRCTANMICTMRTGFVRERQRPENPVSQ